MLSIFTRHTATCKKALEATGLTPEQIHVHRNCACAKWYSGTHEGKWHPRTSLKTNSWEQADKNLDLIKQEAPLPASGMTTEKAIQEWLIDAQKGTGVETEGIALSTLKQYTLAGRRLTEFGKKHRSPYLAQWTPELVTRYVRGWAEERIGGRPAPGIKSKTKRTRRAILGGFFRYCITMRWIKENPMDCLINRSRSKTRGQKKAAEETSTLPLDVDGADTNYRAILRMIPIYFMRPGRTKPYTGALVTRPQSLVAFSELMYETGLRVSDTIMFLIDTVKQDPDGWGRYTTIQIKTGTKVTVAIPPGLLTKLRQLPRIAPGYIFYDGVTNLESFYHYQVWQPLKQAGEAAGVEGVRPHRFRDSFAVNRILEGMDLSELSKFLGHASVAITEKYYLPFVKSLEDKLIESRKRRAAQPEAPTPGRNVVPIRKRRVG